MSTGETLLTICPLRGKHPQYLLSARLEVEVLVYLADASKGRPRNLLMYVTYVFWPKNYQENNSSPPKSEAKLGKDIKFTKFNFYNTVINLLLYYYCNTVNKFNFHNTNVLSCFDLVFWGPGWRVVNSPFGQLLF